MALIVLCGGWSSKPVPVFPSGPQAGADLNNPTELSSHSIKQGEVLYHTDDCCRLPLTREPKVNVAMKEHDDDHCDRKIGGGATTRHGRLTEGWRLSISGRDTTAPTREA